MTDFLTYVFWPNPGGAQYTSPKVMGLIGFCAVLIVLFFILRRWRNRLQNPVTKKLSASWPSAALWFGLIGLLLIISRIEGIQFLAMRFLWFIWALVAVLYVVFQIWKFRRRHYEVVPMERSDDPLKKYLPTKRKR